MKSDLFSSDAHFERLPLQEAEVFLLRRLELPRSTEEFLQELIAQTPWRAEEIAVWGKTYLQPRLTAWYGDPGRSYTYSGISMQPLPWTRTLAELRSAVESACREDFNSVLLNYYRNERDSVGLHSDDEPELGPHPVIASLSLGEPRVFSIKHKRLADLPSVRITLESGNLLLMKGNTQANWKHGVAKSVKPCGPRVNLTFRQIRSA
jgi:alkylated DNA repair dioxygenase AlkB